MKPGRPNTTQAKQARIESALSRWRAGDLAAAEAGLRAVVAEFTGDRRAAYYLCALLRQIGRAREAVAFVEPLIAARGSIPALDRELAGARRSAAAATPPGRPEIPPPPEGGIAPPASPASEVARGRERAMAGDFHSAIEIFERAQRSFPDDPDVLLGLGMSRQGMGLSESAIDAYERVVAIRPADAVAWCNLGQVRRLEGRFEAALEAFERAARLAPSASPPITGGIETLDMMGRADEAWKLIEPIAQRGVREPSVAILFGALAGRRGEAPRAIPIVEGALAGHRGPAGERASLFSTLGTLRDRVKDFDGAFDAFARSAALADRAWFSMDRYEALMRARLEVFTREALSRLPRAPARAEDVVLIVGFPRSGTSLVEQILGSHPRVFGAGERRELGQVAGELAGMTGSAREYPWCVRDLTPEAADRAATRYTSAVRALAPGAARITDKMPQNHAHLGLAELILPGARVVHCRRSPLDTCLSCFQQNFSALHAYATDLGMLARAYVEYDRLMTHWRDVLSIPILDVRYEALVADPEPHVRRIVEFCGLEWDEACLRPHESARVTRTASVDQVRRPISASSVGRWRAYEGHLGPLIAGLGDLGDAEARR